MNAMIERLEGREFLSAVVALSDESLCGGVAVGGTPVEEVPAAAAVRYPKMVGTWKGATRVDGQRVYLTVKITSQEGAKFGGVMTSRNMAGLKINLSGKFQSSKRVALTFAGRDGEGNLTGKGAADVTEKGTKLSGSFDVRDSGGDRFTVKFAVKR